MIFFGKPLHTLPDHALDWRHGPHAGSRAHPAAIAGLLCRGRGRLRACRGPGQLAGRCRACPNTAPARARATPPPPPPPPAAPPAPPPPPPRAPLPPPTPPP